MRIVQVFGIALSLLAGVSGCGSSRNADSATDGDAFLEVDGGADAPVQHDASGSVDDAGADAEQMIDAASVDAGPPDAGPEMCTATGMFRQIPCQCGGNRSERCTGGYWTPASMCPALGACTPGTFETRDPTTCSDATLQRTCGSDCTWSDWTTVIPAGCDPNQGSLCFMGINCDCQMDCTCLAVPGCPYPVGF